MMKTISWSPSQKEIIENCNSNTYIAAGPGSGKSTTLSGITEELLKYSENKVLLLTFTNKAAKSILSKVSDLNKEQVIGGTFHSVCYRMLREYGNDFNICDETKKRLIIKKIFNCRKNKELFEEKYEKISAKKGQYPVIVDDDVVRYNEELAKYNMLDFDDLISHGITLFNANKRSELGITHILVDELQDTSQAQLELLKAIHCSTNAVMIGVGDDDQCHPDGEKVLTTNGEINIEDIDTDVHTVASYDDHGNIYGLNTPNGFKILSKVSRSYTGKLYNITVENKSGKCTYNHKCYASWSSNADRSYITYLMRKGEFYRVGHCKLYVGKSFHLGTRARKEKADCCWILGDHTTKKEAMIEEAIIATKYSIPTITFKETSSSKYFKQDVLDNIFESIDSNNMAADAIILLSNYNRSIEFPFWEKETFEKKGKREFFITRACNLIPKIMVSGIRYESTIKKVEIDNISVTDVTNITVHSLEVEKYHNYFCNNILVSNCVYEWRGARYKNVEDFIKEFNCTIRELGINYRSVNNIVSRSKNLIEKNTKRIKKDLKANTDKFGLIMPSTFSDIFKEVDWIVSKCKTNINKGKDVAILYRNRMNKIRIEVELKKAGIEYKVNDSTDISDRSSFRVLISMMRVASKHYDIYDLEECAKGIKKLGSGTVTKIRENIKENSIQEAIKELIIKSKRIKSATAEIIEIQNKFTDLGKDKPLNVLLAKLLDHINDSYDINLDVYSFLKDITKEYKCTIKDVRLLCNEFGLDSREQRIENKEAKVELSTVHGYKGLEKDIVIMPFCNSYLDFTKKKINIEEERRIFYVAFTRAKESIYLSYCGAKPIFIKELGF